MEALTDETVYFYKQESVWLFCFLFHHRGGNRVCDAIVEVTAVRMPTCRI